MRPALLAAVLWATATPALAQTETQAESSNQPPPWSALQPEPVDPDFVPVVAPDAALATPADQVRVLIAGDSWAQYMWDDGSHDDVLDRFGLADAQALSLSLDSDPGAGYTGPEYAVSGSEARQWADTASFPWIANVVQALESQPSIDWVVLSIGGNDVLAGRSDGGWYKDMDLDVPGSEEALFAQIEANTFAVIDAILAVRPSIRVLLSSYDYPNFNVGFWCFLYACPKRDDLSRDPSNDLITDAELNAMMVGLESRRIGWCAAEPRLFYDNSVGLMHHVYGDGVSGPRVLPRPGGVDPDYLPFPGGNPLLPTLRSAFRRPAGLDVDPIHLDFEGYQIKIGHQVEAHFLPALRGDPNINVVSAGGSADGWTDGQVFAAGQPRVGDAGGRSVATILSFESLLVPTDVSVQRAAVWLTRSSAQGTNPFQSGALGTPIVDLQAGAFGASLDLEATDATAPATVEDCALVHGSARANGYTLRLEFDEDARNLLLGGGPVQVRLRFPSVDAGDDWVELYGGDAGAWTLQTVSTFAEVAGTPQPRLDLTLGAPTAVAALPERGVRLLDPRPNPFNPSTELRFELVEPAADARLVVYDLAGRRIRTLHTGPLAAGSGARTWDGRDESGRSVASGVYLARLKTERGAVSRRLVLVR